MKIKFNLVRVALALALLSTLKPQLSTCFAQGSLTPPGAPAPMMKTLDQIEPRTIVNAANTPGDAGSLFIITKAGSYYLTTNLVGVSGKNGIKIAANHVTLDLNGFALLGVAGSSSAVDLPGALTNCTVRNGAISGWGSVGVYVESYLSRNMVFERLNISANNYGIYLLGGGLVCDCTCVTNSNYGIYCYAGSNVSGCTADNNGNNGIDVWSGTVSGCSAQGNGATGIYTEASTVSGCSAQNNAYYGIYAGGGSVSGCYVLNNKNSGIYVDSPGTAVSGNTCRQNNTSNSSGAAGIYIADAHNRIEDNLVTDSGYAGIQVMNFGSYIDNVIIKNSVSGNGANNYILPAGQVVGPLITNTVSGIITNSNPWANFSF